ncbi:hypothetical protein ACFL1B_04490 [Nanoarchaeota archaeon]
MEVKGDGIHMDKVLNNLDKFVLDFVKVLEKHADYVLVSGYVSILFGRSRISEDIDILIPKLSKKGFVDLHEDLLRGCSCLNVENLDELYDLLLSKHSIRYAKKSKVIPNMEVKFVVKEAHKQALKEKLKVFLGDNTLFVSPIELQIAYKELVLGSPKDEEDALHLREVFKGKISKEKIKYYQELVKKDE